MGLRRLRYWSLLPLLLLAWVQLRAQGVVNAASVTASLSTTACPGAGCATLTIVNYGQVGVQLVGSFSGTVSFQGSVDRANFSAINCTPPNSTTAVTSTTTQGTWLCSAGGLAQVRAKFTSYGSGAVTVTIQASPSGGGAGGGGGGASGAVIITDPVVSSQQAFVTTDGKLSITCGNCSGSGASSVDTSNFTVTSASGAPAMGIFEASPSSVGDGQVGVVGIDATRRLKFTAPSGAILSGAFASGSISSGAVASGAIASGAFASGSVGSGAIASGAVASGAFASGSIGSGAIASGAIASGAVASGAVASGAFVSGSVADGAVVTLGAKADAKSTATDATQITVMQVLKEISAMEQAPAALATGSNVIGHVIDDTGSVTAATLQTQTDTVMVGGVNLKEVNAHATVEAGINGVIAVGGNQVANNNVSTNGDSLLVSGSDYGATPKIQLFKVDSNGSLYEATTVLANQAGVNAVGSVRVIDGTSNQLAVKACDSLEPTTVNISQTTNTQIITGAAGKNNYICGIFVLGSDAENVSIIEGTGSVCATSPQALIGGVTAATGQNMAANGGFVVPFQVKGKGNNQNVCLFQSGSGRVAGVITFVQR